MALLAALVAVCSAATDSAGAPDRSVYMDRSRSVDARVDALLAQMTPLEKQCQTIHLTGFDSIPALKAEVRRGASRLPHP